MINHRTKFIQVNDVSKGETPVFVVKFLLGNSTFDIPTILLRCQFILPQRTQRRLGISLLASSLFLLTQCSSNATAMSPSWELSSSW